MVEIEGPRVAAPVGGRDFILDQANHCLGIGHAQQRLREARQGDTLVGGKAVFGEEISIIPSAAVSLISRTRPAATAVMSLWFSSERSAVLIKAASTASGSL